jgi:hypothetical protein
MKGIIFTELLFPQVISGVKFMTRRIVRPPKNSFGIIGVKDYETGKYRLYAENEYGGTLNLKTDQEWLIKPRYKIGETVFLKEPYDRSYIPEIGEKYDNPLSAAGDPKCWKTIYRFDGIYIDAEWNNKLFMPAKYARHFIKITDVCCERLQDISDEDCIAEGIIKVYTTPQAAYAEIIDRIHGKGTWKSNPYVHVYTYKLINEQQKDFKDFIGFKDFPINDFLTK